MCAHPHLSQCALTPSLSFPDARLLTIALLRTSVFLPPGSLLSGRLCFPRFPNSSHLSVLSRARTSELPLQSLFCILLAHKNCMLLVFVYAFMKLYFVFFLRLRERRVRESAHPLLYFPNDCDSEVWAKARSQELMFVSSMWLAETQALRSSSDAFSNTLTESRIKIGVIRAQTDAMI